MAMGESDGEEAYEMMNADACTIKAMCVLCALALAAPRSAACAGEPVKYGPPMRTLCAVSSMSSYLWGPVASCEEALSGYRGASACERLPVAEIVLDMMGTEEWKFDAEGYEWKPGSDDLSLPAGRAKWALELLLDVKLPGNVDRHASAQQLKTLREQARLVVEAYRQGIMDAAADHPVSPEAFARLKLKYRGKVLTGPWASGHPETEMDELLLGWPPIGRKYEDLVSIVGAKADKEADGVSYTFDDPMREIKYTFVVQGGVIHSVRKTTR